MGVALGQRKILQEKIQDRMITRFGTQFAGNVDIDDIGLEGIPVNDRSLPDERLATIFDKSRNIAQAMDRLGYSKFWGAEHHFQREGYECIPNLLMLFVHLAQVTERIKFGCAFNILPMWHPLRLAEDFATADHLTGGRIVFGVGRGYHVREVESLGGPSTELHNDANRELFEEGVELIMKAFNQESFSHHGKHYDAPPDVPYRGYRLKEISLVPRPRTLPVEIYQPIVSGNQHSLDFMVQHGFKGVIGGGAGASGGPTELMSRWRDTLAKAGKETELGGDLILNFAIHLADTEKQAMDQVRSAFEENMKMFAPLGFVRGLSDEQMSALGDPARARAAGLPSLKERLRPGIGYAARRS